MQMNKSYNSKEACRRYLEKIKTDPAKRQEYLEKAAIRMRVRRAKLRELANSDKMLLESQRKKDSLRQKKYRNKILRINARQPEDVGKGESCLTLSLS